MDSRLDFGTVADTAEYADRIADVLALDDERQAVRQYAHHRLQARRLDLEAFERCARPIRQLGWMGFAERDALLPAEAAARSHGPSAPLRNHDRRHRVREIQVLAGHAIDLLDGHLLDALQILIG